jgi:hypothetical protein
MKKLFWSAFAMSLILHSLTAFGQLEDVSDFSEGEKAEFLELEAEVLPKLDGPQQFSPRDLHEKDSWNVQVKQVEVDTKPLKGQGHSLIPWSELDPESWLSVDKWLLQRKLKDQNPDWKLRLRDDRQTEHMGKVLQCRGKCDVYRGTTKATVQHLSRIDEGDEFITGPDSVAWVYLIDGSLVRIGPSTSISFQEINWTKDQVFIFARLQKGHVFWHNRNPTDFPEELSPETDAISLPLLVREANVAWFERELFQKQSDADRSVETMKQEEVVAKNQIKKINELRKQNNSEGVNSTQVMIVAPNVTLVGNGTSFDLFHYPGGKSHFKRRLGLQGSTLNIQLRGYTATAITPISEEAWYEVEVNGRSHSKVANVTGSLEITELLTRRIKTIELAREFWMEKYTLPIVKSIEKPKELAIKHGYKLWNDDFSSRYDFLVEYTRRMETTNLKSMDNLLKKIEGNGEYSQKEMGQEHYKTALNYYLRGLKNQYTNKNQQVREMSDLQYYVWILRHGKK